VTDESKYKLEVVTVLAPESEDGGAKQCEQVPKAALSAISKL